MCFIEFIDKISAHNPNDQKQIAKTRCDRDYIIVIHLGRNDLGETKGTAVMTQMRADL